MRIFHRRSPSPALPAATRSQQSEVQPPPPPVTSGEAQGLEHHGLVDRVRNFIRPDRTLPPCPAPEQPLSVEAAVGRVRREAPRSERAGLTPTREYLSLYSAMFRVQGDGHRAVIVQEMLRLHPAPWPNFRRPSAVGKSGAWAEGLSKVSPALAHDLVSHIVRLVPNTRHRLDVERAFEALKRIRDPGERSAVVEHIVRFPAERRLHLDQLIDAVAALKDVHRGPTLQYAHSLGWDGGAQAGWPEAIRVLGKVPQNEHDELLQAVKLARGQHGRVGLVSGYVVRALAETSPGHRAAVGDAFATVFPHGAANHEQPKQVIHALAKVKKDLPSVAACAAHLCTHAMPGDGIAKVIRTIGRLSASRRDAVVLLVRNMAPESSSADELVELLEELEHVHEDDADCLPMVSQLALQDMSADDLFRAIHTLTRVPQKRRSSVVNAAMQLRGGGHDNGNSQDWARVLKELGKFDQGVLTAVVADARRLCPEFMPGVQRVRIVAVLAGITDRDERADFVRLGETLQRGSAAYWTQHHPLSQLARTPVSERSGVVANLACLCPPGTPSRNAMESVMQTLRSVNQSQRADFTTQLLRLLDTTGHTANDYVNQLADIFAPLQPRQRRALADFVLRIAPDGGSHVTRERLMVALARVPENERADLTNLCTPLREIQPAEQALTSVEAVVRMRPLWRSMQAASLMQNYTSDINRAARGGGAQHTETARYYAARQRENVMSARLIKRIGESWKQLNRLYPQAPARRSQLASTEAWLATYPTSSSATDAQKAVFCRVRGGATEIQNALRVINDRPRPGDYSDALRRNEVFRMDGVKAGIGDMFERIWFAIETYRDATKTPEALEHEKDLMRYSAFIALSQCIEDDGHRVCGYGFLERCFIILQGRIPGVFIDDDVPKATPQQVVAFVTERLADQGGDRVPSLWTLRKFFNDNVRAARDLYGANSAQAKTVEEHLNGYLDYTYESWQHSRHEADPQLNAWRAAIRQRRNSALGEVEVRA